MTACTEVSQFLEKDQTESIVNNPETFLGTNVTLVGRLEPSADLKLYNLGINYKIKDKNGFALYLKPEVKNEIGSALPYVVNGKVENVYICDCEYKTEYSTGYISINGNRPKVEDCEKNEERGFTYRCRPGSNQTLYYVTAYSMRVSS